MKRMLCALLAGLLLIGSASAAMMNEYTLAPFAADTGALLTLTFGDQADKALTDDRDYVFYSLPDSSGAPFCLLDHTAGFGQMRVNIYTPLVALESHEPYIWDNIEPSGVAKCTLSAQEAQAEAEAVMQALGMNSYALQAVTAYGRIDGLTGGYMVAFGQQVDGVPVYWAAALHYDEMMMYPESNRAKLMIGDRGLVFMDCHWSVFLKTGKEINVISETDALAAFAAIGEQADTAELCYLLTGTQDAARAVPAYRYQNRFISAADGTVLQ